MAATKVQYGQTNYRINREPIDAESIWENYAKLEECLGDMRTAKGALYPGMTVAVNSDPDPEKNGLYLIGLQSDGFVFNYIAKRILTKAEIEHLFEVEEEQIIEHTEEYIQEKVSEATQDIKEYVDDMLFNWGHLE